MATRDERAAEEEASIEWERATFEQMQLASFPLAPPSQAALQEAAEAAWKQACANMDRIGREILTD